MPGASPWQPETRAAGSGMSLRTSHDDSNDPARSLTWALPTCHKRYSHVFFSKKKEPGETQVCKANSVLMCQFQLHTSTWSLSPQPKLLARELLDLVSSHFNLKEKQYFGLTFIDDTWVSFVFVYSIVCLFVCWLLKYKLLKYIWFCCIPHWNPI